MTERAEVYLDTETTSLDPRRAQVWEAAYAVGDGPIIDGTLRHTLDGSDPRSLAMNGYFLRFRRAMSAGTMNRFEAGLMDALSGAVIIGANPSFDASMLFARWGEQLWHYRMLDIESYAAGVMGWRLPLGLKETRQRVIDLTGAEIPEPDHTARGDVDTLRCLHRALLNVQLAQNTPVQEEAQ